MTAEFKLITEWRIRAPLADVYNAISHCLDWPVWWQGASKVEKCASGDADGVGDAYRFTWRGPIPYRVIFVMQVTRVVPCVLVEGCASGDVAGIGRWHFVHAHGVTIVHYEWRVDILRWWMNFVAPFARPVFRWNHHQVMLQGAKGLAHMLNARLEAVHTREM